jgi:hypothetical protein
LRLSRLGLPLYKRFDVTKSSRQHFGKPANLLDQQIYLAV